MYTQHHLHFFGMVYIYYYHQPLVIQVMKIIGKVINFIIYIIDILSVIMVQQHFHLIDYLVHLEIN